jgi:xanthine dehydrogenase accessory factor
MEEIHDILNALSLSSKKDVLATIIHVEGSAYRREGTSMLFRSDGITVGMLSPGCLETDLSYRVPEIVVQGRSQTIVYNLQAEHDAYWGHGIGCKGIIHVLLEPIDEELQNHLVNLKKLLEQGNRVTVIKRLDYDESITDYLFISDNQQLFGKWHRGDSSLIKKQIQQIHQSHPQSGVVYSPELSTNLYIHSFEPKPRLLVFGAGLDAIPIVKLASMVGFSVTVADWREALCSEENFPDAQQLLVGFPSEVVNKLTLTKRDSVLILTHHFKRDQEILQLLMNRELKYLGIIGTRDRTQRLFEGEEIPPYISSPAGLSIGAVGPEEIAVSIVAELIQRQRKRRTGVVVQLDGKRDHGGLSSGG